MDEQFVVRVEGCALMGRVWGAGPGVVLLHGAGMDHEMFHDQIDPLVDAGFKVVVPDLRGHGRSLPSSIVLSPEALERDVLAVMDELGMADAALIGLSLGGNLAQGIALSNPERVRALIAMDCAWNAEPLNRADQFSLRLASSAVRVAPWRWMLRRMARASASTAEGRALALRSIARFSREQLVEALAAAAGGLGARTAQRIEAPCLLICGAEDRTGRVLGSMRRWAVHDGLVLHEIAGAGHLVNVDAPERVNGLLLDFLAGAGVRMDAARPSSG